MEKILLGISACLIGQKVRYDGGHKHDSYIVETLGRYFEFIPVCPEAEAGLGIPREPMRLEGDPAQPRLVTIKTGRDMTDVVRDWAGPRLDELAKLDLYGFIFKSRSPSSGMERVPIHRDGMPPLRAGTGIFARAFMDRFPQLPTEEEGRLQDPGIRENFIERVFTLRRWRESVADGMDTTRLIEFHTAHKLLVLSHGTEKYREMGRLVGVAKGMGMAELYGRYQELLMDSLRATATPGRHANVLMHIMGYFKKLLTSEEKQELLESIENYRKGNLPLIVPVTLVNHYTMRYDEHYLKGQYYLHPHPVELRLRNHS